MKDKLLYLTIGLLIGIVVMQWTMPTGNASGIHPGGIVGIADHVNWVLDEFGVVWGFHPTEGWQEHPIDWRPPVPSSQIKFWNAWVVITTDNVAWYHTNDVSNPWVTLGPWPGGAVQTKPETWGGVKGKYEGK